MAHRIAADGERADSGSDRSTKLRHRVPSRSPSIPDESEQAEALIAQAREHEVELLGEPDLAADWLESLDELVAAGQRSPRTVALTAMRWAGTSANVERGE